MELTFDIPNWLPPTLANVLTTLALFRMHKTKKTPRTESLAQLMKKCALNFPQTTPEPYTGYANVTDRHADGTLTLITQQDKKTRRVTPKDLLPSDTHFVRIYPDDTARVVKYYGTYTVQNKLPDNKIQFALRLTLAFDPTTYNALQPGQEIKIAVFLDQTAELY